MAWSDKPGAQWKLPPVVSGDEVTTRNPSCPRYIIKTASFGNDEFQVMAHTPAGKRAGYVQLWKYDGRFQVTQSKVFEGHRRCGLGTKLYEAAAKLACSRGERLASDDTRSEMSDGFWRKQERKGRARCVRKAVPRGDYARGGCEYYELIGCPDDLSGQRRRRSARTLSSRGRRR